MTGFPASARGAGALFCALLLLCLGGVPARLGSAAAWLAELATIALGALLVLRAARRAFGASAAVSGPLRVAAVLLVAISIGQMVRSKKAFPFMPYTMYGRAREGEIVFHRFTGVRASGAVGPFRPSRAFAALGNGRLAKGLQNRFEEVAALRARGEPAASEQRLLGQVIGVLLARENRHAADPLVRVDVERARLSPPYDRRAIRSEPFTSVAAGREP